MMGKIFGYYSAKGLDVFVVLLIKCGFGVGKLKKVFAYNWKIRNKDKPLDVVYHDLKLRIYPNDNTIESRILFSSKLREKIELQNIKDQIKNGGVFVDIGANVGYYSLMAAKYGATKVVAIEPNPIVLNRLKDNIKFNGYDKVITPLQIGVGESKGTLELTVCNTDMGSSSVVNKKLSGEKIRIDILPLYELMKREKIKAIDALKIDIEGMEDKVLFPYFEKIDKSNYPKLIVIEDSSQQIWDKNILEWMLDNGYRVLTRTRGNIVITTNP